MRKARSISAPPAREASALAGYQLQDSGTAIAGNGKDSQTAPISTAAAGIP